MAGLADPNAAIELSLDRAKRLILGGHGSTLEILSQADAELTKRLYAIAKKHGGPTGTYSEAHAQLYREQIRLVTNYTKQRLAGLTDEQARLAISEAVQSTVELATKLEERFTGITRPLALHSQAMQDEVIRGTGASLIQQNQASWDRYGKALTRQFETVMRVGQIAGLNHHEMISKMVAAGKVEGIDAESLNRKWPSYFPKPTGYVNETYWAERIVRTEVAYSYNAASTNTIQTFKNTDFPDMQKKILAHFDVRTAPDSVAVHGQVRPVDGLFVDGAGRHYRHPPARPNDRETVIPWRPVWEETDATEEPPAEDIAKAIEEISGKEQAKAKIQALAAERAEKIKRAADVATALAAQKAQAALLAKQKPKPAKTAAQIMDQQLEGPSGSNAGGVFLGTDEVKRYVKLYDDPAQAAGEHLANQLYGDLGLGRVKSQVFKHNGKVAYASQFVEGATPLGKTRLTPDVAKRALRGLIGDLVTGNWDALGLDLDNVVKTKGGRLLRIDNGGSFLMRAKAGRKATSALNALSEWEGFFDSGINPAYARLAGIAGVGSASELAPMLRAQLRSLDEIAEKAGGWSKYVKKHAPLMPESDRAAVVGMLEARIALLKQKVRAAIHRPAPRPRLRLEELQGEALPNTPTSWPLTRTAPADPSEHSDRVAARTHETLTRTLTRDEVRSINEFTGSTYGDIRLAARLSKEDYQASRVSLPYETAKAHAEQITSALRKRDAARAREEHIENDLVEVFRGIRDVPREKFENIINSDVITWAEPTSTSWDPDKARNFYSSSMPNGHSVMFRVRTAARTKGLAIEGISGLRHEHEVLFGNDVEFKVTKVVRDQNFARGAVVYLEEI